MLLLIIILQTILSNMNDILLSVDNLSLNLSYGSCMIHIMYNNKLWIIYQDVAICRKIFKNIIYNDKIMR